MLFLNIFSLFFCCFFHSFVCEEDLENYVTFNVYHSLEPCNSDPIYTQRGHITYYSSRNEAIYSDDFPLSDLWLAKLKQLATLGDIYRIKVLPSNNENSNAVFSFTKACSIYESGLTDHLIMALDQSSSLPISIGIKAIPPYCTGETPLEFRQLTFNTTVNVVILTSAPPPDTLTYIQRLEQEKAEKARGDQGDNRSFFTKYWMYIVPIAIFVLISGASNPEAQGNR